MLVQMPNGNWVEAGHVVQVLADDDDWVVVTIGRRGGQVVWQAKGWDEAQLQRDEFARKVNEALKGESR
jgi:hypothetical protein